MIGTSHSIICVYSYNEKSMEVLEMQSSAGAVTSMDVNEKLTNLISGYEDGTVVL